MKSVVQLRKIKDKADKRYKVRYRFYHKNVLLCERVFDIHDIVLEMGWKCISFEEHMELCRRLFGFTFSKYTLVNTKDFGLFPDIPYDNWLNYQDDGYNVCLNDRDLEALKDLLSL
jgi:hypothetical protein